MVRSALTAAVLALALGAVPGASRPVVTAPVLASPHAVPSGDVPIPVPPLVEPGGPSQRAGSVAFTAAAPDDRAAVAIDAALAQLGLPYVWGGDGPGAGDAGFDCSGLTHFAYAAAGVDLPRTAHTQYYAGPRVPPGAPLLPGDLVFYGVPERVHHVGLFLGDGRMVNAPRFGKPVQVAHHRWPGDDYLGATRPAASDERGLLPPVIAPLPLPIPVPEVFEAPPAPLPDGLVLAGPAVGALDTVLVPAPGRTADPDGVHDATAIGEPAAGPPGRTGDPAGTGAPAGGGDTAAVRGPSADEHPAASSSSTRSASPPDADPRAAPSEDPPEPGGDVPPDTAAEPQTPSDVAVLALPAGEVEIAPVDPGPDGLPAAVGTRDGVLRVPPALLAGVAPDTHVVLTTDGTPARHVVRSAAVRTGSEASALRGSSPSSALVIVAPTGEGRWTVLVTGPAG